LKCAQKGKKQAFNITGRKTKKKIDETSAQNPQKENKTQPRKPKMVPREQPILPFVLFSKNQKRLDFSADNNMNTPKTPHQKRQKPSETETNPKSSTLAYMHKNAAILGPKQPQKRRTRGTTEEGRGTKTLTTRKKNEIRADTNNRAKNRRPNPRPKP
jgi:hypothetical protein